MARTIPKRKDANAPPKIKIPFNVPILNSMIKYIRCEYVGADRLDMLLRLLENIDIRAYESQPEVHERLTVLLILTRLMVKQSVRDENLLLAGLMEEYPDGMKVIDAVGFTANQLNSAECDQIAEKVEARTQALVIFRMKDKLIDTLNAFEGTTFETSYHQLVSDVKEQLNLLLGELQIEDDHRGLLREFSFSDKDTAALIDKIIKSRKAPSAILQTGIRQLNLILNPGFFAGGLYTILGGSGKFKSGTLLNIADQMRKYNPQVIPYENGMRKTILYITLENSIEMTFERLYDMYSGLDDELREKDTAEVLETLRSEGGFTFTDTQGIDLTMVYRGNLEINTSDVRSIIQHYRERGKETICVIVDYIKRIQSTEPSNGDERLRMSYAAKELRNIAQDLQIPVITAMQLNREGNSIIDSAMRENKSDVARFVGPSNIGNAWDIIEDSDWVCLINPEKSKTNGQLYLTFKRLKNRNKSSLASDIEYFNHPFVNEKHIRLVADVDLPKSVSIISINTDLESVDDDSIERDAARKEHGQMHSLPSAGERAAVRKEAVISSLMGTANVYSG